MLDGFGVEEITFDAGHSIMVGRYSPENIPDADVDK